MKTAKMFCPIQGCKFIGTNKAEWVEHFKAAHPDKKLKIGNERI